MLSVIFKEKAKIYLSLATRNPIANDVKLIGNHQYKAVANSVVKSNNEDRGNLLNCKKESRIKKVIQSA